MVVVGIFLIGVDLGIYFLSKVEVMVVLEMCEDIVRRFWVFW